MSYTFDTSIRRYRDSQGRLVSASTIRDLIDGLLNAGSTQAAQLTQQLVDGQLTTADWESQMRDAIKGTHVAASAAARGGWAQMSLSDWGWTGRRVRAQYDFLADFRSEIEDTLAEETGLSDAGPSTQARAGMYIDAARGTHSQMERRTQRAGGATEEKRVLARSNNCEDCIAAANKGWQPIGSLPAIGDTQCVTNCSCHFEYRNGD